VTLGQAIVPERIAMRVSRASSVVLSADEVVRFLEAIRASRAARA